MKAQFFTIMIIMTLLTGTALCACQDVAPEIIPETSSGKGSYTQYTTKANDETYFYPMYTSPTRGIDVTDSEAVWEKLTANGWSGEEEKDGYLYFRDDGSGTWTGTGYGDFTFSVNNGRLVMINDGGEKKTFRFKFREAAGTSLMLEEKPIGETYHFIGE